MSLYICYAFNCLCILFTTNIFCAFTASISFCTPLVATCRKAIPPQSLNCRASLQLRFSLDAAIHLHFKQSGYPQRFELTWISKFLYIVVYLDEGKGGRIYKCQEFVLWKTGLFLYNLIDKIVTKNITILPITKCMWILYQRVWWTVTWQLKILRNSVSEIL